jgi:hypothetical protein
MDRISRHREEGLEFIMGSVPSRSLFTQLPVVLFLAMMYPEPLPARSEESAHPTGGPRLHSQALNCRNRILRPIAKVSVRWPAQL